MFFIAKNNAFLKAFPTSPKFSASGGEFSQKVFKWWIFLFPDDLETNEAAIERKSLYTRPYTIMSPETS